MNTKLKLTKTSVLTVSQDQVSADLSPDLSGDVVILNLNNGTYYALNETGARLWNLIQKPCSVETILDTLLTEYNVDTRQCETDLTAIVEDMAKHGLVEIQDVSNP
jgi:hypothetical protein